MKIQQFVRASMLAAAVLAAPLAIGAQAAGTPSGPQRQAYFGDLHLHTSYSFDAYLLFGAKVTPDDAYRYARGETVTYLGDQIHRSTPPLDFLAVTDHSENIGVFNTLEDPQSELSRSEIGQEVKREGANAFWKIVKLQTGGKQLPGVDTTKAADSAWQREIETANRNYRPGKFTTFIAYEWSAMPDGQNLHRNVIFRGDRAPNPFTSVNSAKPEDLWEYLDVIRKQGYEALAIPHNSNASNGLMFDWVDSRGRPIDQAYAQARADNEPLAEISQNKGASETHPALSPTDEFAGFEFYDHLLISPKKSRPGGSYVRDALGRGLEIAGRTDGVNPFKYGFVGASDFHNGLSDSAENAFVGTFGAIDPTQKLPDIEAFQKRLAVLKIPLAADSPTPADPNASLYENGSGNLTAVWAEENTRESIFSAFRRKETFATSGTRLKLRFFGGWQFPANLTRSADWVKTAYASGVPMGGDLPAASAQAGGAAGAGTGTQAAGTHAAAPTFALWAVKDPDGANLDRLQVVKVWLADGKHVEKIFDVALSNERKVNRATGKVPAVGNTVDLKTGRYKNSIGATELSAVWTDPEFNADTAAVYYLRVLEIPTPRWSTILAVKRGQPLPSSVPATIQERGWSSPIWYTSKPKS